MVILLLLAAPPLSPGVVCSSSFSPVSNVSSTQNCLRPLLASCLVRGLNYHLCHLLFTPQDAISALSPPTLGSGGDPGWTTSGSLSLCFCLGCFVLIFNFISFWLHWVFIAAHGLSLVAESRDYPLSRRRGFSLWWLLLLQ